MLPSYVNSALKIKDCFTRCDFFFSVQYATRWSVCTHLWMWTLPLAIYENAWKPKHLQQCIWGRNFLKVISSDQPMATKISSIAAKKLYTKSKDSKQVMNEDITFRDAWMSKKGLFRTLKGSLVLSICPIFIFSIRGEIISFSMHNNRMLKSHWPTGCPWKQKKENNVNPVLQSSSFYCLWHKSKRMCSKNVHTTFCMQDQFRQGHRDRAQVLLDLDLRYLDFFPNYIIKESTS